MPRPDSILLFAYGNRSRGDDALAPLLLQQIQQVEAPLFLSGRIRVLQDYQIQIEHVVDMQGCHAVLLIDADQSQGPAVRFAHVEEEPGSGYTTHGMTPGQLLSVYRQMYNQQPPPTYLLAIRGYEFELGKALSPQAQDNLLQARTFLQRLLRLANPADWHRLAAGQ